MGIQIEFNPDLALREFNTEGREPEECLPEKLEENKEYSFLKRGQRAFWISDDPNWSKGETPLRTTKGEENPSRPLASIKITEATHFLKNNEVWTRGKFKLIKTIPEGELYFNGLDPK